MKLNQMTIDVDSLALDLLLHFLMKADWVPIGNSANSYAHERGTEVQA